MNAMRKAYNSAQERVPNYHIQPDGKIYRNGKLYHVLKRKKDQPHARPGISYDPVDVRDVEPVTDPSTGESRQVRDPHGIPREDQVKQIGDSARIDPGIRIPGVRDISCFTPNERNVGGPTSCNEWSNVILSKLDNTMRLAGVTEKNARAHAEIHLSKQGRTVLIEVGKRHSFAVTGHGDQVVVTNAWQNKHVIRNEPPMARRQFLENFHTLLNSPEPARRQDAARALFNCDTTAFNAKPSAPSMFIGDQGDPIVPNRNINRNIEGIHQDRHPGAAVRPRDFNYRGGVHLAADQRDATGDGVPDDDKGSQAAVDQSTSDDDDEHVQDMVREMMHKAGFPDDAYDTSMLSEAATASYAAGAPEEDEEPFELCDYCRGLGYAGCMKCLLGRGSSGKKIVRTGNIASFKD